MPTYQALLVAIEAGEALSGPLDCTGGTPALLIMPTAWGGGTDLTFQVSADGLTFYNLLRADGSEVGCAVVPETATVIPTDVGQALPFVKLRAGPSSAPMPRDERREFQLVILKGPVATRETSPRKRAVKKKPTKVRRHR